MKVKGGGRRKSWEAMPLDVVLQDTSNNPNAPFTSLLQLQANAAALEQPQEQQQELQEPQALEEADDGEGEGEGEDDGDVGGDGDREADGVVDDDENRERNKLAEGYYEIEAIRRKRVRKVLLSPQFFVGYIIALEN